MRRRGRLLEGRLPLRQLGDGSLRIGEEAKPAFPLAVVDAMQLPPSIWHRLVGRQGLAAGIGVGWPSLPARRGVKNDLVDIETHVTKP